ncbi:hypothetical protein BT69DRAFT_681546 [Atractiella rhizophila]|nr:hypothetical protein BT69DRAFT_681546 [Atractiella rhizophila]
MLVVHCPCWHGAAWPSNSKGPLRWHRCFSIYNVAVLRVPLSTQARGSQLFPSRAFLVVLT